MGGALESPRAGGDGSSQVEKGVQGGEEKGREKGDGVATVFLSVLPQIV